MKIAIFVLIISNFLTIFCVLNMDYRFTNHLNDIYNQTVYAENRLDRIETNTITIIHPDAR